MKHNIEAQHRNTTSKNIIKAFHQSTTSKHKVNTLHQRTTSKPNISIEARRSITSASVLNQNTTSRHTIEGKLKPNAGGPRGKTEEKGKDGERKGKRHRSPFLVFYVSLHSRIYGFVRLLVHTLCFPFKDNKGWIHDVSCQSSYLCSPANTRLLT